MENKLSSVFIYSAVVLALLVIFGIIAPEMLENVTASVQSFISDSFGWYYLIIVTIFLIVCLYLFISPAGRITLGKQGDKPEFPNPRGSPCFLALEWALDSSFMDQLNPLVTLPSTHRRNRNPESHKGFFTIYFFSLGTSRLGYLWNRWLNTGLFHVQEK